MRALFAAFCALALGACGPETPRNELIVGMDLSYPPFETIDREGKPQGLSVDLARALGGALGRPVRIENIPFTGLIPSLNSGKIDCIISSMTDTPERRTAVGFSDPYLTIGLGLLAGRNAPVQSMADLDQPGRTVVVRQGTTGEVWARANVRRAKILAVEKENAAVLEVIQGRADAFLYDQMSVWKNGQEHPETTRPLLTPLNREQWAIAVRRDDEELRTRINAFLREFRASGGFEALGTKHLSEQKKAFDAEGIPFFF